jgi:hypothetical protein
VKRDAQERLPWIIATVLPIIALVAACGGTALVTPNVIVPSKTATPVAGENNATSDMSASASYCQRLNDGEWVTNDSAFSTTPCVPDPSYATGDEQVDGSAALPRCLTCSLSDWERAEKRAATRDGGQLHTPGTDTTAELPAAGGGSFVKACAQNADGGLCGCVTQAVSRQVPSYQLSALTADDPRVQAALESCAP